MSKPRAARDLGSRTSPRHRGDAETEDEWARCTSGGWCSHTPRVPTGVTEDWERYVVLDDAALEASRHNGLVINARSNNNSTITWYTLGEPFMRDGKRLRYGYLRFDIDVLLARGRSVDQAHPVPF